MWFLVNKERGKVGWHNLTMRKFEREKVRHWPRLCKAYRRNDLLARRTLNISPFQEWKVADRLEYGIAGTCLIASE